MNKYVFVGAGSANVYSVLYLLENGIKGEDIVIIEKGKKAQERKHVLYGFFGAGLFSDGKILFSTYDGNVSDYVTNEERDFSYNFIRKQIIKFANFEYKVTKPKTFDEKLSFLNNINIVQSELWHIGTDNNIKFGLEVQEYLLKNNVKIYFNTVVLDVDFKKKFVKLDKDVILYYNKLIIGTGGADKLVENLISKYKLETKFKWLNIGLRFETLYNERLRLTAENGLYDFKIMEQHNGIDIRTFCVNHYSAYVAQESFMDIRYQFNGHAYGYYCDEDKINNYSNWGVICKVTEENYLEEFLKRLDNKYYFVQKGSIKPSTVFEKEELKVLGDISIINNLYGEKVGSCINSFVIKLIDLFQIQEYNMYIPEIKVNFSKLKLNDFKVSGIPDVSWVGDGCTSTRGISQAATTGIINTKKNLLG